MGLPALAGHGGATAATGRAVRDLWLTAGTVHTFAAATRLRAALLAAAIAVYLLDDSPGVMP